MTVDEAGKSVLPFGKHSGKTIDQTAQTDDGLRYLDWMRGLRDIRTPGFKEALETYLSDPTIARELADALNDDE